MIAKLELDSGNIVTYHVTTRREAFDRASATCGEQQTGGLLIIDGIDYGEFDYGNEFYYTVLTTGETWTIVE